MKEISKLLRKVIRLQKEEKIITPRSSVLIALSGGVDSVVLTSALLELREFLKFRRLALAHFNHMLREEAESEEEFCKEFAQNVGLEIFVGREEVGRIAEEEGRNLEEVARERRYTFLREIKDREGFDLIATAHHLNDLVETALIWLVRGSGLEGLLGFEPKEGDVVRPLYRATREEILSYAKAKNLRWIEDTSNRDPRFFRNRLRLSVIPILKEINPNLEETFLRTREILKEEDRFLKELTEKVIERSKKNNCLDTKMLRKESVAIQRRVIREFFDLVNFSKVEQVRRLLRKGGEVNVGEGRRIVSRTGLICLKKPV